MAPQETPEQRERAIRERLELEHDERLHRRWLWAKVMRLGKWGAIAAGALSLTQDLIDRLWRIWHP